MSNEQIIQGEQLLSKTFLTVSEMTTLIAATMARLTTVSSVDVAEEGAVSVALSCGKVIEMQAVPMARAFNISMQTRKDALNELVKRCA
jgi:hypothetical protein